MPDKVRKTDEQWRRQLTPQQYRIAREARTEPAFTGEYCDTRDSGTYTCVCCGQGLFESGSKFDSGSGWPSFSEPADERNVDAEIDRSHGMQRTEVRCSRCDAHLGHRFDDGPRPGGQRYCINSASLRLVEKPDTDRST